MDKNDHYKYMQIAIQYGDVALKNNEVPVTAILVNNKTKEVIYKAHNMTNLTLNGTAHAEFEIYKYLLNKNPDSHLSIWKNSTLYVSVEPCIMCASMLDQIGIETIVFGCPNERFGGNGSVFNIRYKSKYKVIPGVCHKEAISLLRRFYINQNDKSPTSINKKKRTLKLSEFPKIEYSKFITLQEFIDIWGEEYKDIYINNEFLDFNNDNVLKLPETNSKRQKS
ncbi:tRNA(adenine34) deaminase [Pichia californica]|uniref:tRNA(Adenine34) deaminase n=1 Tax=Pichia californica TaxID=460514 RepID=A0A9P6WJY4_9ASCO|nr:tRNA(adenine34) deaminase [[Candida] californica]KAG0688554.1 tRNA(adenine34) deaminase [[Candida] californica]